MNSNNGAGFGLTEELLSFLKNNPEGVTQDKLTTAMPFKEAEIVECLNTLIEMNRVNLLETPEGVLFKYRSEKEAMKFRGLTKEEMSVHEIIIQSGSTGISTNDLKMKMRIESSAFINHILKTLEKKFLIKSLKVLNTKNKKVWIGFDIQPSQEITGGIWCTNQEYDNNLVTVFSDKCFEYISSQKSVSRKEILLFAKCSNLTQSEMKEEDIQKILNILIFDGKVEAIFPEALVAEKKHSVLISKNEEMLSLIRYQKNKKFKPKAIFDSIPCALCPVSSECTLTNTVNPIECPHLKNFIQLH